MERLCQYIDKLNDAVGRAAAWLMVPLILLVSFDVIARKAFSFTRIWIMDLEWHLFALIFLLAAAYTLKADRHVRVDLFYEKFQLRDKALVDFIGSLVLLIPWCLVVIWFGFAYARESWLLGEGASEPGGLPARYVIKFSVVVGIALLLLQGISLTYRSWKVLRSPADEEAEGSKRH
ncbi:MAG: C4-dicarboxylate ABC transporter [Saprospiraceae bacterium]|nr:MAG: C4-dicarboxylate ABC transporter [Saprospiraceae bacterium]